MKRQYVYIGSDCYKTFTSYNKMKEFAKDETHNGTFYISCPNITFKKTREQITKGE